MKVFIRFFEDDKENIKVDCDWVSITPDYISPCVIHADSVFPFIVRCYYHTDKEFLKIYKDVMDVEVI